MNCERCGASNVEERRVTFMNGTKHIKLICRECNQFLGFKKQTETGYKQELFFIVKDLTTATEKELPFLRARAIEAMEKAATAAVNKTKETK